MKLLTILIINYAVSAVLSLNKNNIDDIKDVLSQSLGNLLQTAINLRVEGTIWDWILLKREDINADESNLTGDALTDNTLYVIRKITTILAKATSPQQRHHRFKFTGIVIAKENEDVVRRRNRLLGGR